MYTILRSVIIYILFITLSVAAFASGADRILVETLSQLQELKNKVDAIQSGDRNSANRYKRQMKIFNSRLSSTRTRDVLEYREATDLFNEIQSILDAKASGQSLPATKPEILKPAKSISTTQHPDPKVEQAIKEIERLEGLVVQMPPGDKDKGHQYMRELNIIRPGIMGTQGKDHPRWKDVANRFNALKKKIVDTANAALAPAVDDQSQITAQSSVQGKPDAAPVEPVVEEVLQQITKYEIKLKELLPGDVSTANKYISELNELVPKLQSATDKSHPLWKDALRRYNAVHNGAIERSKQNPNTIPTEGLLSYELVKLKRIDRNAQSIQDNIKRTPSPEFRDPKKAQEFRDVLLSIDQQLLNFPKPDHPGVGMIAKRVNDMRKILDERLAEVQKEVSALGNLDQHIASIRERVKVNEAIRLKEDASAEEAKAYIGQALKREEQYANDLAYMEKVMASGYGPRDLGSMVHWIGVNRRQNMDSVNNARDHICGQVHSAVLQAKFLAESDPQNPDHRSNRFLGEGQYQKTVDEMNQGLAKADVVIAIQNAFQNQDGVNLANNQKKEILNAIEKYKKDFVMAQGLVRMPKPAEHDKSMIEAAKKTLADPRYDSINPILSMVINSPKRRKEIVETDVRGTVTGAEATSIHKVWDQFQVTTAEETGPDEYYLFHTMLKYFHKGGPNTPTGRWLISGRHKGVQILKENIDK